MSNKKILIVDDEKQILDFLDIELTNAGYETIKAENATQAIEKAKKELPALILMDVILPDLNGAEAVKILKESNATADIPVVFLTAMMTKKEEHENKSGLNIGGVWYDAIAKPFDENELLKRVRDIIEGV